MSNNITLIRTFQQCNKLYSGLKIILVVVVFIEVKITAIQTQGYKPEQGSHLMLY